MRLVLLHPGGAALGIRRNHDIAVPRVVIIPSRTIDRPGLVDLWLLVFLFHAASFLVLHLFVFPHQYDPPAVEDLPAHLPCCCHRQFS